MAVFNWLNPFHYVVHCPESCQGMRHSLYSKRTNSGLAGWVLCPGIQRVDFFLPQQTPLHLFSSSQDRDVKEFEPSRGVAFNISSSIKHIFVVLGAFFKSHSSATLAHVLWLGCLPSCYAVALGSPKRTLAEVHLSVLQNLTFKIWGGSSECRGDACLVSDVLLGYVCPGEVSLWVWSHLLSSVIP